MGEVTEQQRIYANALGEGFRRWKTEHEGQMSNLDVDSFFRAAAVAGNEVMNRFAGDPAGEGKMVGAMQEWLDSNWREFEIR